MQEHLFSFLDASTAASVEQRLAAYRGDGEDISGAVGALVMGQLYGFRGVAMVLSRAKLRRYEELLGLKLRDHMPERTDLSRRILGVRISDEVGKFWAVVKGDHWVSGKGRADDFGQADLFGEASVQSK